jgi:PTS system mannose-specific IIA component
MFGGTPSNLAMTFLGQNVEVITGVNLPMLIKLAGLSPQASLLDAAREMREHGRNAKRHLGGFRSPERRKNMTTRDASW